ncbi:MAG: hypothetical protein GF333_01790 [Candidatus Omnitrophica bacterium]|nr:hypothetical protein [Candidatus Omnitrophota bacterium]
MDVKIDQLIEQIRREGVDEAQAKAEQILARAESDAEEIVRRAREQARQEREEAKNQAVQFERSAQASLRHAARDLVLVLKEKLESLCAGVFTRQIGESFTPEFLQEMIRKVVDGWAKGESVEALLSEQDAARLKEHLLLAVQGKTSFPVEIKVDNRIEHGFRIGKKNESVYFDFTEEGIFEALQQYVSPALREILNRTDG